MADKKISALTASTTPLAGTEVLPIVQSSTTVKVAVSDLTAGRDVSTKNITAGTTSVANTQVTVVASASSDANEPEFNLSSTVFANLNKPRVKSANGTLALLVESGSTSTFQNRMRLRLDGGGAATTTLQASTNNGTAYTDRVTVAGATGDMTLNTGNLIQGTAAKGFNFTANTPAAGMTSQLLNWYEEGSFTPTFTFGGAFVGGSLSTAQGFYTRIGRQVTAKIKIVIGAVGSSTGAADIRSLPFTANSSAIYPAVFRCFNIIITGNMQGYVGASSSIVYLETLTNGTLASFTNTNCTAGSEIQLTATYFV